MQNVVRGSVVYRTFVSVFLWISLQWRKSRVITWFLSEGCGESASNCSIFSALWRLFHRTLSFCFDKLKLSVLLRGSIFSKPYVWCILTAVPAPFLPTLAVMVLSAMTLLSVFIHFALNKDAKLAYSPVNKYILLYAVVYAVAVFTSVSVSGSIKGGALTTLFILFAIALQNSVHTKRQLNILLITFVICGAAVAGYGVYQYVFGAIVASAWVDSDMFTGITTRVYSTLGNPNVLSEYLLLVIPFAFALVLIVKRLVIRLFFAGCLCAMLLCMVLTFARGGWLGLVFAVAVFLVMLDRRFILLGLAGIIALYFLLPEVILTRFTSIGDLGDSSTSYRLSIWLGTISMLRDYWFTGIGPGSIAFNKIYPLYSYNTAAAQHSHNLYLQIMCDAGFIAIVIFIMLIFSFIKQLGGAISRASDKTSKILQIAAISSVSGFLVQSATDYSFYNYRVTLVFWAVVGISAVIAKLSSLPEV